VVEAGSSQAYVRLVNKEVSKQLKELGHDETELYRLILATGNKGAWSKILSKDSSFPIPKVNKVAGNLLKAGLIKKVSLPGQVRKVFVASTFDIPVDDRARPWDGKDGDILHESFREASKAELSRGPRTPRQVYQTISQSGVFKFEFKEEDIFMIFQGLYHEGKIRRIPVPIKLEDKIEKVDKLDTEDKDDDMDDQDSEEVKEWAYEWHERSMPPVLMIPCSSCPIRDICQEGTTHINPSTCVYLESYSAHKDSFPAVNIGANLF